jgi:ATP-dependent Clp protease ATP-binding subunit ClpA
MSPIAVERANLEKLRRIGWNAVKRKFTPEFVNRIDAVITYQPLDETAMEVILDQQLAALQRHISARLEEAAFEVELSRNARKLLLARGTSSEYGARELKRTILRLLTQPLAAMVEQARVPAGCVVLADRSGDGLALRVDDGS